MAETVIWLPLVLSALLASAAADIMVFTQDTPHVIIEEFRDLPASFGAELPLEGLRAFLTVGAPEDGCGALAKPPTTVDNFTGRWAVLLARYNCSFETKVRNAQAAGYDVAVVHNVNSSDLETMSAKDPDGIIIPSVFIGEIPGSLLALQFTYDKGFYIMVNGDLPFNINTHLLLPFAIVVALCLLVMIIFMIVKCIKDRRRARRHRLPCRALRKIPVHKFSKGDPYDTCAVCLDDYLEGERLRVLPCAHAYHAKCIDPWLTQNRRVCPVCKRRVLAAGEREQGSDSDAPDEPLRSPALNTQGGTFEEQSENPFVRAARLMRRLRRAGAQENEDAPNQDDAEQESSDEARPLLASLAVEAERRPRPRPAATEPSPPAPAAAAPSPEHSINHEPETETEQHQEPDVAAAGEIGVAALPAPALADTHIRL